jgi:transposase
MFLKQVKVKGKPYYCIVKSVRINGKPRHKHVKYVGSKEEVIKRLLEGDEAVMEAMKVSQVKDHGEVDLLYSIAEKLELRGIINEHVVKTAGVDVGAQMVVLAINQCLDALALDNIDLWYHHTTLEERLGIPFYMLSTENLCKAMDYIYEPIRNEKGKVIDAKDNAMPIKKDIVEKLKDLFNIRLDTLFYDITSTYFEGNSCIIARLGYSRDKKKGKKQILVGLVVTRDYRFPVFYSVFEGDTSDMTTVSETLKTLQREFKVEKTLLVLDRGMVRPENLEELDGSGFDYICGLKKGEKAVKKVILKAEGLDEEKNRVREDMSAVEMVEEFAGKKRKLVVYKDHEQAKAMKEDRDLKLARALKGLGEYAAKVNAGNYKNVEKVVGKVKELKKGVSKYIRTDITVREGRVGLSVEKRGKRVEEAEKLGGKYLLMCTDLKLSREEVISAYFDKDGIEKVFRSMKQHGLRPVRRWTLNRVKASIFVGYLGQLLLATLGYLLDKAGLKITPERALGYLKWQKKVVFKSGETVVEKISVPEVEAREILEKLESVRLL